MRPELEQYTINRDATLFEALERLERNHDGFLIVLQGDLSVLGTLTDGDLRRALLLGKNTDTLVAEACKKSYAYLELHDSRGIYTAIDLFKSKKYTFLPILTAEKRLANIITRRQLHSLLLQDISADLAYDFLSLDENIVDYEIFPRPWGFYKTTILNRYYQSKVISVNPLGKLSLQSHHHREEHWIVVHGSGIAQIGSSIMRIQCGSSLFIPKDCMHRVENTSKSETLIIAETQIGEYLGEDDIIRYDDIYGRV